MGRRREPGGAGGGGGGSKHVYGPVPSRRFGLSLGIDLIPFKTCCYDCTYCQLGRTTDLVVERRDFFPPEDILADVRTALAEGPAPDVLTLAGSGEPTLYRSLRRLIRGVRALSSIPILLLTNGGLLWKKDLADEAMEADILAPSLDAGCEETFLCINRPHPEVGFDRMVGGLREACARFPGEVRMEVMLLRGVNDNEAEWGEIAKKLGEIRHSSIEINTAVRPVASGKAMPCDAETLEEARRFFGPKAMIVRSPSSGRSPVGGDREPPGPGGGAVLRLIARRPCTVADIHTALGIHRNEVVKILDQLVRDGRAESRETPTGVFFVAVSDDKSNN